MNNNKKGFIILGVVIAIVLLILLPRKQDNLTPLETVQRIQESMGTDEMPQVEKKQQWQISRTVDEMTDKERVIASLRSSNTVNFDFPYEGGSYLTMSVRRWNDDLDVYFRISKGQFVCNEYRGTDIISIRFDDEEPVKYNVVESSTGDSDILFIKYSSSEKTILSKCKTAHTIKVQANFYEEGSRVFTFEPDEPLANFE